MARRMSRFIHLAMAAGKEAVADCGARLHRLEPRAARSGRGRGQHRRRRPGAGHRRHRGAPREGPAAQVSPFAIPALSGSMAACQLSMEYGLTGPVITQVAACASSVIAFLDAPAHDPARRGRRRARRRLGGAAAADRLRGARPTWARCPSATTIRSTPRGRSTGTATGSCSARAPASWSLESAEHALARGATIQCRGHRRGADRRRVPHLGARADRPRRGTAMTKAMRDAGVAPDEVDYIVAHGTSTPLNDVTETRAIKAAFGDHAHRVAISSPKSMVGHMLGAAGVMSALAAIGAIREGVIPPTINLDEPDLPECDLDYVPNVARAEARRHGDHQRLRVRRPERGRRLPALRGVGHRPRDAGSASAATCPPRRAASSPRATPRCSRPRAVSARRWACDSSGSSEAMGSRSRTSSAAPPRCPERSASTSAAWSTRPPA